MAVHESQVDAVSRVYAQSLFELAEAKGGQQAIEEVADELESIVELARADRTFGEFLASRILATEARESSIKTIFSGKVSDLTFNFLLVLNEKDRLGRLSDIAAAYDYLLQEKFGRVEVDVFTAAAIDQSQLDSIKNRLSSALGKEPVLHAYTDAAMLGGLKLQVGDQLIDASVATRLRRMKDQLATEGGAKIRGASERFLGA